jgi:Type III restriction enzyme, res subunit
LNSATTKKKPSPRFSNRRKTLPAPSRCSRPAPGKPIIFTALLDRILQSGERALVLAHREELLTQARDKIALAAPSLHVEIEQAASFASRTHPSSSLFEDRERSVVVGSMQTLRGKRLKEWAPDAFRIIILDEAHHANFAKSTIRARVLCAGNMTFGLAEPHLRGVPDSLAPDLGVLMPAAGSPSVALGALLRRLGLWYRISATLPQMRQRMRDWLAIYADLLRTSLARPAYVNEVLRGSGEVDIFVLGILLECDRGFGLEPTARRSLLKAAEEAVFKRFASALNRKDIHTDGPCDFRSFEFYVIEQLVTATGLSDHRFEETFLGFTADGLSISLAPEVYEHERSRAIYFISIAALAATRTNDTALLKAVRRCLKMLCDQRFGGRQLLTADIVNKVREEAGLDLPMF